jgi:PTS system mannose-specific IIB component/fructoselysine and glucoselysine-specific PTS system IIB component
MPFEAYRVDDRLVHGQVVVGWGQPLDLAFLVVVDDALANEPWEQDLYRMAAPPGMDVHFASVDEAVAQHEQWRRDPRPGMLLTGNLDTMARLAAAAPEIRRVILGGLHACAGKTERLRYVYLDAHDEEVLRALAARGVECCAQDLPSARPVPATELLKTP